jgi:tetratricopeptide (TPR) repeat protein
MMGMGNAYLMRSDVGNAEKSYGKALMISARDKRMTFLNESAYSLGMLYLFEGKMPQARQVVERLNSLLESSKARILKGFYKALTGDAEGALKDYREVLSQTEGIDTVVTLVLMGDCYRGIGMWDEAITQYNRALSLDPGFSSAYYGIGAAYLGKRNLALAETYLEKTLSLDESNAMALSDRADILLVKKERPEEALQYALRAVSKSPFLYQPYLTTANVLIVLGRDGEADAYYEKALERGLPGYMVPLSKARSFYLKGDMGRMKDSLAELRNYKDLPGKVRDIIRDQAGQK